MKSLPKFFFWKHLKNWFERERAGGGGGGECIREKEKHQFVIPLVYTFIVWFLYLPWPCSVGIAGRQCSNHWTSGQGQVFLLKKWLGSWNIFHLVEKLGELGLKREWSFLESVPLPLFFLPPASLWPFLSTPVVMAASLPPSGSPGILPHACM